MKFKEEYKEEKQEGGEVKKSVDMQRTNMDESSVVAQRGDIYEALTQTQNWD